MNFASLSFGNDATKLKNRCLFFSKLCTSFAHDWGHLTSKLRLFILNSMVSHPEKTGVY